MRVLVTGATGFVGGALCRVLAAAGFEVSAGVRRDGDHAGSAEARVLGDLGDDGDPGDLGAAVADVDAIVHLAARSHVVAERAADPLSEYRRINVAGTRRLAEAARDAGVRRFVFLSSVKVNGEASHGGPFTEDDPPAPGDAYAVSKWEAEQLLGRLAATDRMETVVLRAPLVYGPGVKANFLSLIKLCDSPLPLPLGAAGGNLRSVIYLGNLNDALRAAVTHPAAAGRTYLVRDRDDVSTAGLVRCIREALGRPPRLVPVPAAVLRAGLTIAGRRAAADRLLGSLAVDAGRIERELGWTPSYTIDQGLRATIGWYRGGGR